MKDSYLHKGLRKKLVQQLIKKGIQDQAVLDAIGAIPRHLFVDSALDKLAYEDQALPIGNEQTISQPYTVAYQSQLLEVKKREKILEIGTGSGYQAAVLKLLGGRVYTIERQEDLHERSKKILTDIDILGIRFFYKDGFKGLPEYAPFDKIIVTCGAATMPEDLLKQLKIGGKIVIPFGEKVQQMLRITRQSEKEFTQEIFENFKFVPFLKGTNPKK